MTLHWSLSLLALSATLHLTAAEIADSVYFNGNVVTVSESQPAAQAFALRNGRFLAVGSNSDMEKLSGPSTTRVDLHGQTVVPGLIDSHTHPIGAALSEREGTIPTFHSLNDVFAYVERLAAHTPPDQTIHVPKVYASRLKERRYANRYELDRAAPGRVVLLDTGYNAVLSSKALEKAHISKETPNPKNGRLIRDENQVPTGLILGAPQLWQFLRPAPVITDHDRAIALGKMQKSYNSVGITSTVDRGIGPEGFRAYQLLRNSGGITVRTNLTYLISGTGTPEQVVQRMEAIPVITGFGDEWMRVGAIKVVADGGVLLGTAYLREPYGEKTEVYGYHDPSYRGELDVPGPNLIAMARAANRMGWQMTAHTTGGGATDLLLDAYEAADREHSIVGRRFTVTHGNFPDERAIARAKKLGVVFDCQPAWMHIDAAVLQSVFGEERMRFFQPFRSMIDAGLIVAGGSDHMVRFDPKEAINPYHPFFGMWMAITRKLTDGSVFHPEQSVTRMEALRMWTWNGAYMMFEEKEKGSIEPGKLADFTVISKDYLKCPVDEIKNISAVMTVVGGKVLYRAQ
jgi:hypothetical protein